MVCCLLLASRRCHCQLSESYGSVARRKEAGRQGAKGSVGQLCFDEHGEEAVLKAASRQNHLGRQCAFSAETLGGYGQLTGKGRMESQRNHAEAYVILTLLFIFTASKHRRFSCHII
jgi:hypothetical protein